MTILTVVPENGTGEAVLAVRYQAAFEKTKAGREQWIEGTLELAAVMLEGRKLLPNDQAFSRWIEHYNLHKINKDQRSALLGFAKDPIAARALLEATVSFSWDMIWRERKHKRVRIAPTPRPAHPPSPRRAPRPAGRRRYGQIAIPDVMREYNKGVEWKRAAAEPLPIREFKTPRPRGLLPEQVDPEFKGTPLEFATQYGHVNLHTKGQIKQNEQQELLSIGHSAIAEHERTGRVMLAALAKVDPETLAAWLRKPGKQEKLQGWIDSIQRAYDALRTLKSS